MTARRYAPFYCEENVWWLAQEPQLTGLSADVVIVSNERRSVAVFGQRAASVEGAPVVWDYHVVLAVRAARGVEVWDLDCTLGAPLEASEWLAASFDATIPPRFAPRFRLVEAARFVAELRTDRSHMRVPGGRWRAPPPPWPILGSGAHDLERFVDVHDATFGETIDLDQLRARWR